MKRVLVLGATGMLGSMVQDYLRRNPSLLVAGSTREPKPCRVASPCEYTLDATCDLRPQLEPLLASFPADYVINCIGVINIYCRDNDPAGVLQAVSVNALFPHLLCDTVRRFRPATKVLHITTDCVFSGRAGNYDESALHDAVDFYGKSKSLGEVQSDLWLNLRCSIIGPEARQQKGLLEWFLAQPPGGTVKGFAHHHWNGITTLQYAQFCEEVILHDRFEAFRQANHTLHYIPNETVSKCDLLQLFNEVYDRHCHIEKVTAPGPAVNRTLASIHLSRPLAPMRNAIQELKSHCERVSFGVEWRGAESATANS